MEARRPADARRSDRSSPPRDLHGLSVLVMGLGRFGGGVGAVRWLQRQGAFVTVSDQADAESLRASVEAIGDSERVRLHLGGHDPADLEEADLLVVNPAVDKRRSAFFQEAVRRGLPWTTELNLFCERCPAPVIAVTGTYGKSTTVAMLESAMRAAAEAGQAPFEQVFVGGNIGRSLLPELDRIGANDRVVLEISNAQLEDLPRIDWFPETAVITNLSPHHLDRHGGYEAYVQAKLNLIGPPSRTRSEGAGPVAPPAEEWLRRRVGGEPDRLVRVPEGSPPLRLRTPGRHNRANAACVLTIARILGLPESAVREAVERFPGLPHRIEHVGTFDGVDYYNDSKSTSPEALIVALEAMEKPVVLIAGGLEKGFDWSGCAEEIARRVRVLIGTGQSGPALVEAVRAGVEQRKQMECRIAGDLPEAVRLARSLAQAGEAVLYSPGAPSFDAYPNFVARGEHFIELVRSERGVEPRGRFS